MRRRRDAERGRVLGARWITRRGSAAGRSATSSARSGAIAAVDAHARRLAARGRGPRSPRAPPRRCPPRARLVRGRHRGELEPHAVEDHLGRRVVALALRLLLAVPVGDVAEHDAGLVRMRACARSGNSSVEIQQQRVEPAARLVDRLGDEVGREARLELGAVLVRVAPLRERHRARVEPASITSGTRRYTPGSPARVQVTSSIHGLCTMQVRRERRVALARALELRERVRVALADLGDRRGRLHAPGLVVHPDVERRAPEALARERPVDVVAQEVAEAAVADVLGQPVDARVVREARPSRARSCGCTRRAARTGSADPSRSARRTDTRGGSARRARRGRARAARA